MISNAIKRAYAQLQEKRYTRIFWCIDLHGTCIKSNYQSGDYEWINPQAREVIKLIRSYPESKIILWSSCYPEEKPNILNFFKKQYIDIDSFNENPGILNTKTGYFEEKCYVSVIVDDKAGFEHETDWIEIRETLKQLHK